MELLLPDGTPVEDEAKARAVPDSAFDAPDGADTHLTLDRPLALPPRPVAAVLSAPPAPVEPVPVSHVAARVAFETAGPVVDLLLSIPLSLLPEPWRERFAGLSLARGTALSGVLEALGSLAIAFYAFRRFSGAVLESAGDRVLEQGSSEAQLMGLGLASILAFTLTPLGAACAYGFAEGLARAFAGLAAREAVGTLPLFLAERAVAGARTLPGRMRLGRWVPDVSRPGEAGGTLVILSARPKPWDARSTIRVEGELYGLAGPARSDDPERPHAYLLGPLPGDHMIRGVIDWPPAR